MKILLTGAAGMLGSALVPALKQKKHEVFVTDLTPTKDEIEYLDVRDFKHVEELVKDFEPKIVMHLAAETDVDKCEISPDHAFKTNTIGTQNVSLVCQKQNIVMVYISTIGVFYGDQIEPYTEFDIPNPINVYGRSNLKARRLLRSY